MQAGRGATTTISNVPSPTHPAVDPDVELGSFGNAIQQENGRPDAEPNTEGGFGLVRRRTAR